MGIERIEISGFRSLKHVVWEPSNLNVLIGPNGSGKSNVLRALELLSFAANRRLTEAIDDWRGISAIAWNHTQQMLDWKVRANFETGLGAFVPLAHEEDQRLDYQLTLSAIHELADFHVFLESLVESTKNESHPLIERDHSKTDIMNVFKTRVRVERADPREALLALKGATMSESAEWLRDEMAEWMCYHDLRVDKGADVRKSAQARRMDAVEPGGQNLTSVLHTHYAKDLGFRSAVDDAMKAAFGDDYAELTFPPADDTRIQLRLRWKSLSEPQSAADLSDGILRFLQLLAILAAPQPPSLIAIDEPETGLHPSMLPILAEYAVEASQKTQVILTTHSPGMLDAFSEVGVAPKVSVALWENGQTVLKTWPDQRLQHWLKEYSLGRLMSSGELEELVK